jgi:hypothetical protein
MQQTNGETSLYVLRSKKKSVMWFTESLNSDHFLKDYTIVNVPCKIQNNSKILTVWNIIFFLYDEYLMK